MFMLIGCAVGMGVGALVLRRVGEEIWLIKVYVALW